MGPFRRKQLMPKLLPIGTFQTAEHAVRCQLSEADRKSRRLAAASPFDPERTLAPENILHSTRGDIFQLLSLDGYNDRVDPGGGYEAA